MSNHCLKYHGFREGAREYWKEIHKDKEAINPFTRARKSQNQENPILQNQNISTADLDINESDDAERVHVPDSAVSDQVIEILSQNSNSSQSAIINAMQNVVLESDMIPDLESGDKRDTVPLIEIDSESGSNLVRDVVNEAQVDGKRCCKTDHRSAKGVMAYETIEKKSAEKSLPYR